MYCEAFNRLQAAFEEAFKDTKAHGERLSPLQEHLDNGLPKILQDHAGHIRTHRISFDKLSESTAQRFTLLERRLLDEDHHHAKRLTDLEGTVRVLEGKSQRLLEGTGGALGGVLERRVNNRAVFSFSSLKRWIVTFEFIVCLLIIRGFDYLVFLHYSATGKFLV
ncbi:hypothetical protein BV25DRAFT_1922684 [Artomyces pyxidatus]|uniref:Uncharacterized protein n=1 Tax=Artomyces pyxidatus TaxID=48021 RepID=A0ACB8SF93_9AGAM|nr:hypothetical protein BV25DRAFT_1922684 [Artomyces pyxidatus]